MRWSSSIKDELEKTSSRPYFDTGQDPPGGKKKSNKSNKGKRNDYNTDIIDKTVGGIGVNMSMKEGIIELAKGTGDIGISGNIYLSITKTIGKATGVVGAGIAWYDFYQKPTTGGLVKALSNTGLVFIRINPFVGFLLGISDLTGGSDWFYNQVGNAIDKIK